MFILGRKKTVLAVALVVVLAMLMAACTRAQKEPEPAGETREADVIVVGAGAAGLAASIEAANAGAKVILLEKLPAVGGSTLISGGIVYGAETPGQKRIGVEDSAEDLARYWIERAEGDVDEELIRFVAEKSGETIAWLEEFVGVEFQDPVPAGTSPVPRGHTTKEGRGAGLVQPLEAKAKELGVEILTETTATKLLTDDKAVIGVEAETKDGKTIQFLGKAVVLATGGFDRDEDLRVEYAPVAKGHISYTSRGNTGDGLKMAREVGAEIISKNGVIGFRGVAENMPYTSPLGGLIFTPGLYVDSAGKRFVNESVDYPIFYDAMIENGDENFYLIFDANSVPEALKEGVDGEVAFEGETLAALAEAAGIDPAGLEETVNKYNQMAEAGEDTEFGKSAELLTPVKEGPFYALRVKPAILGTFGGPKINTKTEVIGTDGQPIPGLYAAGEVANGQFFKTTYPASGTSIQMCFTLGRVAGREAAAR